MEDTQQKQQEDQKFAKKQCLERAAQRVQGYTMKNRILLDKLINWIKNFDCYVTAFHLNDGEIKNVMNQSKLEHFKRVTVDSVQLGGGQSVAIVVHLKIIVKGRLTDPVDRILFLLHKNRQNGSYEHRVDEQNL